MILRFQGRYIGIHLGLEVGQVEDRDMSSSIKDAPFIHNRRNVDFLNNLDKRLVLQPSRCQRPILFRCHVHEIFLTAATIICGLGTWLLLLLSHTYKRLGSLSAQILSTRDEGGDLMGLQNADRAVCEMASVDLCNLVNIRSPCHRRMAYRGTTANI